jgi:precorrin-2 dehydrogenase/sirohydrochlorin ferrochelatase
MRFPGNTTPSRDGDMHDYPLFLDLAGLACLVAGAGAVGRRKILGLLQAGAREVRVVEPAPPDADMRALMARPGVRWLERAFRPADVEGCSLVFAAAADPRVNRAVVRACGRRRILCNAAQSPEDGSFAVPVCARRGHLRLAVSTGGVSPAMTRRIADELAAWAASRYDRQLALLARLRPLAVGQAEPESGERSAMLRRLADEDVGEMLARDDLPACAALMRRVLPPALHAHIPELLHEPD